MPKKARKKIGDRRKRIGKRREERSGEVVSVLDGNDGNDENVEVLGDIVEDVEVVNCDSEEFGKLVKERNIKEEIFVIDADLFRNHERKYMHILVDGDESPIVEDICIVQCPKLEETEVGECKNLNFTINYDKVDCEVTRNVLNERVDTIHQGQKSNLEIDLQNFDVTNSVAEVECINDVAEVEGNVSSEIGMTESIPEMKTSSKNNSKKMCSAKYCQYRESSFHAFPSIMKDGKIDVNNLQRCYLWVQRSGNEKLLEKPTCSLHRQNFLCSSHFREVDVSGSRLLPGAVPKDNDENDLSEELMSVFPVYSKKQLEILMNGKNDDMDSQNHENNHPKIDEFQKKFEDQMKSLEWRTCPVCKETFFCNKEFNKKCLHSKPYCKSMSEENGMDPGEVPEELKGLSYTEEQLIAQVRPIVVIVKLSGHQLGYKGNVVNFHQDVQSFAKQLPHKISDLTNILTVRGSKGLQPVDFHVRADKVRTALQWLINNNKYYFDVTISEDNLRSLPENGNVFDDLNGIDLEEVNNAADINVKRKEEEEDVDQIFESGTPVMRPPSDQDTLSSIIDWPPIGKTKIDEFKTEGYIAKAFPTLFPFGEADLRTARPKSINPSNYFKHLMRFKDKRFAQHPRFRYFALNSVMRWAALREGNIFIQANEELKNMTLGNLKDELKANPSLAKKLMYKKTNIQGTRSYWFQRGQELLEMIEQIGLPTLFFTLSAADLHWPDLFKLLAPNENFEELSSHRRWQLIRANPLIVDEFFLKRVEIFFKEVLEKKYQIKDYWYRIEYQHRGSPHIHGVLWIDDAPDVTKLSSMTEEDRQKVADYFSNLVTAFNPNPHQPKPQEHPCRKFLSDIQDLDQDLSELLNRVQMHSCSPDHCMRMNKKTKQLECRFHFPQQLVAGQAQIVIEDGVPEFKPERNQENLNKFNKYFIQTWRANIDVAPVISKRALINYLAKYISKSEKKSSHLADLMNTLNNMPNEVTLAKTVIRSLYVRACAERDFSAQEACHLLMGFNLVSKGGRPFQSIHFEKNNMWRILNDGRTCKSLIEKYQERNELLHDMCLWEVAKKYCFKKKRFYPLNKQAIVQVFPKYKVRNDDAENNEKYYRQQVLLFVPWKDEQDLKLSEKTWKEIYDSNLEMIQRNSVQECNIRSSEPDEDEFEEVEFERYQPPPDEYMVVSMMGPSQAPSNVELGHREVDTLNDWHKSCSEYDQYGGIPSLLSFVSRMKAAHVPSRKEVTLPDVSFTDEQKVILNLLDSQIQSIITDKPSNELARKVIVQGKAGTGKSLIISAMTHRLQTAFGDASYLLMGFTGISAVNISGGTIHSTLTISIADFNELSGAALFEFKKKLEKVKFIIIDEYSTVGCELLFKIDSRLRQAMDAPNDEFGNLFVYMFGDINQLPPVIDPAPYSSNQNSMEAINGKILYDNFDAVITLQCIQRQKDENFQNVLNNVSSGCITKSDYDFLKRRFKTNLSPEERTHFKDAVHLFPLNAQVNNYNEETLNNLIDPQTGFKCPVAKAMPKKKRTKGRISVNVASSGNENLYLAKGCKVMLRQNIWTDQGLANGAVGEVVDILYDLDSTPQEDPPAVVICTFPSYKGPYLDDNLKTVPIGPTTTTNDEENGEKLSISQFPLTLCYACTIHKSQGLTLDKVVVDLGDIERQAGLSYVGLSRVKSISGLMLEPFTFRRCEKINNSKVVQLRRTWLDSMTCKILHAN